MPAREDWKSGAAKRMVRAERSAYLMRTLSVRMVDWFSPVTEKEPPGPEAEISVMNSCSGRRDARSDGVKPMRPRLVPKKSRPPEVEQAEP